MNMVLLLIDLVKKKTKHWFLSLLPTLTKSRVQISLAKTFVHLTWKRKEETNFLWKVLHETHLNDEKNPHCNPVQGSTGPSQGISCNENWIHAMRTGFFPVRISSQGKSCFHYKNGFAVHVGYWAYRDIYALSNLAKAMYYIALNLVTDNSQKRTGQALFFSFEYNLSPNLISK